MAVKKRLGEASYLDVSLTGSDPEWALCGADLGKMKGEQKAFYTKMQRLYAIKRPKAEQERNDKINDILLNCGDLSVLENQ